MTPRRLGHSVAAAAAAAAIAASPSAAALVSLPSPTAAFRETPPLRGASGATAERRIPGRIHATTLVRVVVDGGGRTLRLTALNRLLLRGTGDYTFAVPAPALAATTSPGSASAPGLRQGAVLWQGFVAGHRLLGAQIELNPKAARSLPLRMVRGDGGLTIENATAAAATVDVAPARAVDVARQLDAAQAAFAAGRGVTAPTVRTTGPVRTIRLEVRAPIRVVGVYRFSGSPLERLSATVGDSPLPIRGRGTLTRFDIRARPAAPGAAILAARGGLGPDPVRTADARLLRAALATQYQTFLLNPDPLGRSSTTYRYVLGRAPVPAAASAGGASVAWWIWVLAAFGACAFVAGATVVWAHQ